MRTKFELCIFRIKDPTLVRRDEEIQNNVANKVGGNFIHLFLGGVMRGSIFFGPLILATRQDGFIRWNKVDLALCSFL